MRLLPVDGKSNPGPVYQVGEFVIGGVLPAYVKALQLE